MTSAKRCRLPDISRTRDTATGSSRERRVGVEIELSGLGYDELVALCAQLLEGEPRLTSRYVTSLKTALGEFTVELDSDPVKELDLQDERLPESIRELGGHAMTVIDAAAEKLVPLEIVSPPFRCPDSIRLKRSATVSVRRAPWAAEKPSITPSGCN